ncbi:hypothetical protein V8F20_010561 [Naviculisporaceae sp. PSN 640]
MWCSRLAITFFCLPRHFFAAGFRGAAQVRTCGGPCSTLKPPPIRSQEVNHQQLCLNNHFTAHINWHSQFVAEQCCRKSHLFGCDVGGSSIGWWSRSSPILEAKTSLTRRRTWFAGQIPFLPVHCYFAHLITVLISHLCLVGSYAPLSLLTTEQQI